MKTSKLTLLTAIFLAMSLTVSCSTDDSDDPSSSSAGGDGVSSSTDGASSAGAGTSSDSGDVSSSGGASSSSDDGLGQLVLGTCQMSFSRCYELLNTWYDDADDAKETCDSDYGTWTTGVRCPATYTQIYRQIEYGTIYYTGPVATVGSCIYNEGSSCIEYAQDYYEVDDAEEECSYSYGSWTTAKCPTANFKEYYRDERYGTIEYIFVVKPPTNAIVLPIGTDKDGEFTNATVETGVWYKLNVTAYNNYDIYLDDYMSSPEFGYTADAKLRLYDSEGNTIYMYDDYGDSFVELDDQWFGVFYAEESGSIYAHVTSYGETGTFGLYFESSDVPLGVSPSPKKASLAKVTPVKAINKASKTAVRAAKRAK